MLSPCNLVTFSPLAFLSLLSFFYRAQFRSIITACVLFVFVCTRNKIFLIFRDHFTFTRLYKPPLLCFIPLIITLSLRGMMSRALTLDFKRQGETAGVLTVIYFCFVFYKQRPHNRHACVKGAISLGIVPENIRQKLSLRKFLIIGSLCFLLVKTVSFYGNDRIRLQTYFQLTEISTLFVLTMIDSTTANEF